MADALDSNHTSIIKKLRMQIGDKAVIVNLETKGDCWDEIRRVRRKEDLLVKKPAEQWCTNADCVHFRYPR